MARFVFVSFGLHVGLMLFLLILGWIPPLRRPIEPPPLRAMLIPRPAPAPVVPPSPPPPPPPETPPVVKKSKDPKKIVKETKEVVDKTPTPEPTPEKTPEPTPKETPRETPKETPQETPKVTPAPTVATPQPTVALPDLPAPAVPPAVVVEGAMTTDAAQWVLGPNYAQQALWRIQQNFRPSHNLPVTCEVAFRILKDGTIDRNTIRIVRSSGRADLDQSAIRALHDTAKLPELYASFKKPYLDVSVTFDYEQEF